MADTCNHLDAVRDVTPSSDGCEDCLPVGGRWIHLGLCMHCGHVGCCDSSPNRHATAHRHARPHHPVIRSYEPGEDWWWCYEDQLAFEIPGAAAASMNAPAVACPIARRAVRPVLRDAAHGAVGGVHGQPRNRVGGGRLPT